MAGAPGKERVMYSLNHIEGDGDPAFWVDVGQKSLATFFLVSAMTAEAALYAPRLYRMAGSLCQVSAVQRFLTS